MLHFDTQLLHSFSKIYHILAVDVVGTDMEEEWEPSLQPMKHCKIDIGKP